MLDRRSFEPAPGPESGPDGEDRPAAYGGLIGEIEVGWLLDHVDMAHRRLPNGVFDELTRQARELLYLEWLVLEPERLDFDDDGRRPAVSPNTALQTQEDVAWFRHLLDQLWLERSSRRTDRRHAIVQALLTEAESLRRDLRSDENRSSNDAHDAIGAIIDEQLSRMRSRASDRSADPDVERTIGQLTDKFRLLVRVAALTETPSWPVLLAELTERAGQDRAVKDAWVTCGYLRTDIPELCLKPQPDAASADIWSPEWWGRDPLRHLRLMLDPSGPVDARPVPDALRGALRTPAEGPEVARAVALEVRRATFPSGLCDSALRARWFLAVLFAESRWSAAKLRGEVARHAEPDPVPALRHLIRSDPAPHTLDRARGAALLHADAGARSPVDGDGWPGPVADIAFEGARSSQFAVPVDVALALAPVDTCGIRLRGFFGDGPWNRAGRFGEVGVERLCELTVARYRHKIYQRLLKDDQLGTGSLRNTTPTQWHAVTTKQMRREASTTMRRYHSGRPLIDDRSEPEPQDSIDSGSLPDGLDPEVVELFNVGVGASDILATVTSRWLATRHSRVGVAMSRRIAELQMFRDWLDTDWRNDGSDTSVLRGTDLLLRQALHRFVIVRGDHVGNPRSVPDAGTPRSDLAVARARQRASERLLAAITTMLVDLGRLPNRGGRT